MIKRNPKTQDLWLSQVALIVRATVVRWRKVGSPSERDLVMLEALADKDKNGVIDPEEADFAFRVWLLVPAHAPQKVCSSIQAISQNCNLSHGRTGVVSTIFIGGIK